MDTPAATMLDATQWLGELRSTWFASLRVGAMFMAAPLTGSRAVPVTVRLVLTLALCLSLGQVLPVPPQATSGAIDGRLVLAIGRELAIGVALGFFYRIAFEAAALAGELVSQSVGLSFAQWIDPLRGASSGVMGQWFWLAAGFMFFALDGHLALVRLVAESWRVLPPGAGAEGLAPLAGALPAFLARALVAGVGLALPIVIALLIVNLGFGVLARTAPSLNPIAIGLPATLLAGLVLLGALLPRLATPFAALFEAAAGMLPAPVP
ncbi:flagellar biosynthetic protein FliR [Tahibacter soli]|uniref:Flagellar biosynthetic protein FliR n=1 Tax=Tahibacter soli TaxID=2983605 RepID=A0A9X3YKE3_9GAMM|nr:flagellar biosynthetic protein FliR [Tahibacter soli]MDC8012875.1 flagellar biosynthetic protein FliR [Tahibacter soli]